jgi:hypothetical protein
MSYLDVCSTPFILRSHKLESGGSGVFGFLLAQLGIKFPMLDLILRCGVLYLKRFQLCPFLL